MSVDERTEEFRDVEGFPGYRVSNFGRVQSCHKRRGGGLSKRWRDRKLTPLRPSGHLNLVLKGQDGKLRRRYVHHLVLIAFVGPRPEGMETCHFDDNPANNHVSNLRWDTHRANHADRVRNGRLLQGENAPGAKLTDEQVLQLLALLATGVSQREAGLKFGLTQSGVSRIKCGQRRKNLRRAGEHAAKHG